MTTERTKLWYLKNLDMFSHLRDEEHKMIDKYSSMREVKKGEILYLQGSSDKNIYILKKGAVKITKLTPHGKELILDIIKGGTILGEMTVVEPHERDESAVVIEDGLICTMKKEDFARLLQMVPGLSIKTTKMIGLRRWKIENKLLDLLYSTVEERLAKTFLNLLDDFGIPHDGGFMIKVKLTHKDYADLIGSTRETVTATLNKLKNDNLLDFEGKYIVIKSMEKISSLAR
jgi:CRP-like cAMP-binding protein